MHTKLHLQNLNYQYQRNYKVWVAGKQLSKSKFNKAETPEAFEMIKQTKKHALQAVKLVNKYLK